MKVLVFFLLLTSWVWADLPPVVARCRAKYDKLPLSCKLLWKASVWGEAGTTEETFSGSYWNRRTILQDFPWSEAQWVDASQCRETDSNGLVNHPQGTDEQVLRLRWRLICGQWMLDSGCFSALPPDSAGNPRVSYEPPGGLRVKLTFDPQGDLSQAEVGHITLRWAHYEKQKLGYQLPKEEILNYQGLANPELYQLVSAESAPSSANAPAEKPPTLEAGICELPLSLVQDRWTQVPVTLGGKPYIFILDSGASDTVLDINTAQELGFRRGGQQTLTAGIFHDACWVRSGPMLMGGVEMPERTLIGVDLRSGSFAAAFPGVRGILGHDLFARFVVVFDYLHARLQLVPRESFRPQADDQEIECRREGPGLDAKIQVGDQIGYFTLDTGSGGGLLVQHLPGQERWVSKGALRDPQGAIFGTGVAATWLGSADVHLGPFFWKGAPLKIVDESSAKGSSLTTQGNIGVAFLRHFRLSLDVTGGRLWLAQQRPFRQAAWASVGMRCSQADQALKVVSLVPKGPASKAGLVLGDKIVTINGCQATAAGAGEFFEQALPGEKFDIEFRRGDGIRHIRVVAEVF